MQSTPNNSQSNGSQLRLSVKTPLQSIGNIIGQVKISQSASNPNLKTIETKTNLDNTIVSHDEIENTPVAYNKRKIAQTPSLLFHSDDTYDDEAVLGSNKRRRYFDSSDDEPDHTIRHEEPTFISLVSIDDEGLVASKQKKRPFKRPKSDDEASDQDTAASTSSTSHKRKRNMPKRYVDEVEDVEVESDEDDSDEYDPDDDERETRKNIRKIKDSSKLGRSTKSALKSEVERIKRLNKKQQVETEHSSQDKLYLEYDPRTKKSSLEVDPTIVSKLKPHQREGIKFMWNSCYESLTILQRTNSGSGCILAHCMGLGKTLQVIAFVHTLLSNSEATKCQNILILMPVNVISNWVNEIKKWAGNCKNKYKIKIHQLPDVINATKTEARIKALEDWSKKGGVFLMGYKMFAQLVDCKKIKAQQQLARLKELLIEPGPDLIICDEGHILKNDETILVKSISQIKTKRRIVLTGTPLQNNLKEYYCMASFVKPNLLGSKKEFTNRFANPINNGQHKDSTHEDVLIMKRRASVLHRQLSGIVDRKDFEIIRAYLPPKNEYVISIRLKPLQVELYKMYLEKYRGVADENATNMAKIHGKFLFKDFQQLCRIWTHPWLIRVRQERKKEEDRKLKIKQRDQDLVDEDDENMPRSSKETKKKFSAKKINAAKSIYLEDTRPQKEVDENIDNNWFENMIPDDCENDYSMSGKLVMLGEILRMCDQVGDKLVVFSQSLPILDMIEQFLLFQHTNKIAKWRRNRDYYRIDGRVSVTSRSEVIDEFNSDEGGRLFLSSTKAGGIGINLVGANRALIFDSTWNPSYDSHSIFRIYRFGQVKEIFVYRFLAQGTMEEKIYMRQCVKNALAQRVIDEHQLDRHFTVQELRELYSFQPDVYDPTVETTHDMPTDGILKSLLHNHKNLIVKYHQHDSLLQNKIDEGLTEEERRLAWAQYEEENRSEQARKDQVAASQAARQAQAEPAAANQQYAYVVDPTTGQLIAHLIQPTQMPVTYAPPVQVDPVQIAMNNGQLEHLTQMMLPSNHVAPQLYQIPPMSYPGQPIIQQAYTQSHASQLNQQNNRSAQSTQELHENQRN